MSHPTTSLQLYTLREELDRDASATFDRIAELGFSTVEPFNLVHAADMLEEQFARTGIRALSAHAMLLSEPQDAILDAAKRLGIPTVIDPCVHAEHWTTRDDVVAIAEKLNAAAAHAAAWGITVGYHNHWWEVQNQIDGKPAMQVLAEHLNPEVVLEVDTYWAMVAGVDVPAFLTELGERVKFLHIKDGNGSEDAKDQVALGAGTLPLEAILAATPHRTAHVVELDDTRGDMFTAVADSAAHLKTIGAF